MAAQGCHTGFPAAHTLDTAKVADRSPVHPDAPGLGLLDSPALDLTHSPHPAVGADTRPMSDPADWVSSSADLPLNYADLTLSFAGLV